MRGVGGIRLTGDDCSTDVPGLYAAGDAASRERLTGAISGGGGPNSSWAIASGNWAGRAAAEHARRIGGRIADRARRRRSAAPGCGRAARCATMSRPPTSCEAVREEMLPLDRNIFRDGRCARALAASGSTRLGGAGAACAWRRRGSGQDARGGGADGDRPLGLPQRTGPRREPRHASSARPAGCRSGLRLPVRGERAGRGARRPARGAMGGGGMIEIVSAAPLHRVRHLRQGVPGQRLRSGARGSAGDRPAERLPDLLSCARSIARPMRSTSRPMPRGRLRSARRRSKRRGCSAAMRARLGWRRGKPGGADKDPTFRLRSTRDKRLARALATMRRHQVEA